MAFRMRKSQPMEKSVIRDQPCRRSVAVLSYLFTFVKNCGVRPFCLLHDPHQLPIIDALRDIVLHRLISRGWDSSTVAAFTRRFFALSVGMRFGTQCLAEVHDLQAEAEKFNDIDALRAIDLLGCALVPLFDALGAMAVGLPVFLVTDLDQSYFLDERTYRDWVQEGIVPKTAVILQVNDHVNAILNTAIGQTFPITLRASDRDLDGDSISQDEQWLLEQVRQRNFSSLIIHTRGRRTHLLGMPPGGQCVHQVRISALNSGALKTVIVREQYLEHPRSALQCPHLLKARSSTERLSSGNYVPPLSLPTKIPARFLRTSQAFSASSRNGSARSAAPPILQPTQGSSNLPQKGEGRYERLRLGHPSRLLWY